MLTNMENKKNKAQYELSCSERVHLLFNNNLHLIINDNVIEAKTASRSTQVN